jgi:hypothetical protein
MTPQGNTPLERKACGLWQGQKEHDRKASDLRFITCSLDMLLPFQTSSNFRDKVDSGRPWVSPLQVVEGMNVVDLVEKEGSSSGKCQPQWVPWVLAGSGAT